MPTPSLLSLLGSKGSRESRYAPIFTDRWFVGYWSNRNPLRSPLSTFYADGWHLGGTDALIAGTNVELSPRLTLCRRPGNIKYGTATIPTAPIDFYSFKQFVGTSTTISLIVDTPTQVYTLTTGAATSIFTKGAGAGQANFLGIGGTLYFGDGVETKKWDGTTIWNWQIAAPSTLLSTSPPTTAATYWQTGASYGGGSITFPGRNAWILDTNNNFQHTTTVTSLAKAVGQTMPTWGTTFGQTTADGNLIWTNSGPNSGWLPNTLYQATQVLIDSNNNLQFCSTAGTSGTTAPSWSTTPNTTTTDNAATWTCVGPAFVISTGIYQYCFAYHSSVDGSVSTASPITVLGPIMLSSSTFSLTVSGASSSDAQVDYVYIFRTTQGQDTFLFDGQVANGGTWSFTDTNADTALNILIQAPINDANDPPPAAALDPVLYLGVPWVHVGNVVYFGRTQSAIAGISATSFPPANSFTFPEQVIRKVPINAGSNGAAMLVFTVSNVYPILGNNTSSSPLYSAPAILNGYGLLSWNALWIDGSVIYFYTSDYRLIRLDPSSGVEDLGFPIGDQLAANVNPASAYVTVLNRTSNDTAVYIGDGSTGWYRCNPNQAPDSQITGPVWSPKATIIGGCGALAGIEVAPGDRRLLIGGTSTSEPVLYRDSSYTIFSDNGTAYAANFTIGSVVLAQPGQYANCRFITYDAIDTGTQPQINVLLDEISGTLESLNGYVVNDPPYLVAPSSLFSKRFYFRQTVAGGVPSPCKTKHLQIKVDYGSSDTVQNELLSLTINGAIEHEK